MRSELILASAIVAWSVAGCAQTEQTHEHSDADHGHGHGESWAVTAWGDLYEIFAEADPLAVGDVSGSHTHVTVLSDFSALTEGSVAAVLRADDGSEQLFTQGSPVRDGIFDIEIRPRAEGEFDLLFRVESPAGLEEISAGRVRVGSHDLPGAVVSETTPSAATEEPISFLKEQQWRTPFATAWVKQGTLHHSLRGPGRVRPVMGGEVLITAPLDGVVVANTSAFVGSAVNRSSVVLELSPRVGPGRSFAELKAELKLARSRLGRLEELLAVEAASQAEVEEARGRVASLEPQFDAVNRRASSGEHVAIRAPFTGRIAEVHVIPGQAVAAGDPLIRVVKAKPLWVEVALHPIEATALTEDPQGLALRPPGAAESSTFSGDEVRLVSLAPEVNPATGSLSAILEFSDGSTLFRPGVAVEVEILLGEAEAGIVVPAAAVVDDGGVPVVYVQIDGEGFARREVRIRARQGDSVLVDGLAAGERLVTRGGAVIRRASLLDSGVDHGHVH